jgi:hypothetical protein
MGGRQPGDEPDSHSTTGTTDSGGFVGRVAGEDADDAGESGAERRAEQASVTTNSLMLPGRV